MDDPFVKVLERFNRKERNLLVRDILGCRDKPVRLSTEFCERLAPAVGILGEHLYDAWWTTDFHFDWLAGALLTFMTGETSDPQKNRPDLVKGTQEDVDLVVVAHTPAAETPHHLILIEAKAYSDFTKEQHTSKVARYKSLREYYRDELERESWPKIAFHYVLYSPTEAAEVDPDRAYKRLQFRLPLAESPILVVERCTAGGERVSNYEYWRCNRLDPTKSHEL